MSNDLIYFFTSRQNVDEPEYIGKWWKAMSKMRFGSERIVRPIAKKKYYIFLNRPLGSFNFSTNLDTVMMRSPSSAEVSPNVSESHKRAKYDIDLNQTIGGIRTSPNKFKALELDDDIDE